MTVRRNFITIIALALALLASVFAIAYRILPFRDAPPSVQAREGIADSRLKVVASFSILADLAANVGGDRIALVTLVGPDGDTHAYEPSPADARAVASADVVVVNGLGFEGWIDRLIQASGYRGPVVAASRGVVPIRFGAAHHHGHDHDAPGMSHDHEHPHEPAQDPIADTGAPSSDVVDPHAWQSVANARIYVSNIAAAFSAADPDGATAYAANAARYQAELGALERWIVDGLGDLPADRRTVITSHGAFGYFGAAYGLAFVAPQGLSTQAEPSARDVAALIELIRKEHVNAVFLENITDPRLLQRIAAETGVRIGGTLYSDALSRQDGPAATYVAMMRHNESELASALQTPAR